MCHATPWRAPCFAGRSSAKSLSLRQNLAVIIRLAAEHDAVPIASLLNAHLAATTIEWAETPHTPCEGTSEIQRLVIARAISGLHIR